MKIGATNRVQGKGSGVIRELSELPNRLIRCKLITLLLVGALLLCHGAMGPVHQYIPAPGASVMQSHSSPIEHGGDAGKNTGGINYLATLLVLLFGGVFWIRFLIHRESRRVSIYSTVRKITFLMQFNYLRCPTAPLLQVFRL